MASKRSRFSDLAETAPTDELTLYLLAQFSYDQISNVIDFWKTIGSKQFPKLSKIANRLLCIPASSASSERAFSKLQNIARKRREHLKPSTVKDLSFLNSNL